MYRVKIRFSFLDSKSAIDTPRGLGATALGLRQAKLTAGPKRTPAVEFVSQAEAIPSNTSAEQSSQVVLQNIERSLSVLHAERCRLTPIARREHWIALIFAVLSGSVFLGSIVLSAFVSIEQTFVSLAA